MNGDYFRGTEGERKGHWHWGEQEERKKESLLTEKEKKACRYVFFYAFTLVPCILRFLLCTYFKKIIHALQPIHGSPWLLFAKQVNTSQISLKNLSAFLHYMFRKSHLQTTIPKTNQSPPYTAPPSNFTSPNQHIHDPSSSTSKLHLPRCILTLPHGISPSTLQTAPPVPLHTAMHLQHLPRRHSHAFAIVNLHQVRRGSHHSPPSSKLHHQTLLRHCLPRQPGDLHLRPPSFSLPPLCTTMPRPISPPNLHCIPRKPHWLRMLVAKQHCCYTWSNWSLKRVAEYCGMHEAEDQSIYASRERGSSSWTWSGNIPCYTPSE